MLSSRRRFLLGSGLTLVATQSTFAANFIVNGRVVSDPNISLQDPEFDKVGIQMTWQDDGGNLWVAPINPATGAIIPTSGQGTLIDTGLAPIADTKNGPEWDYSNGPTQIVYTKLINGTQVLGRALWTGSQWQAGLLAGGDDRSAPLASKYPQDGFINTSTIYHVGGVPTPRTPISFRDLDDATSEERVSDPTAIQGQWVQGQRTVICQILVNSVYQIATYNTLTGTLTQLTFDAGNKNNPYMWQAPEFNNELIFSALIDESSIAVYRLKRDKWSKIKTIAPGGTAKPYYNSPEPFIYGGKSYLSFTANQLSALNGKSPSDVWIAATDPANPLQRRVSDASAKTRSDPESLILTGGPVIYYVEITNTDLRILHRCTTGL